MTLGETIVRLRKERGLSQGDLAEALAVSRQSVSKWETDASVPELDKLIKLSELFEVTLDELVRGERPAAPEPKTAPEYASGSGQLRERAFPPRKIAGTILLCMAFAVALLCTLAGGLLEGLILCLPFLACGLICFITRRHPGLWCAWAIWFLADLYLRLATGIHRSNVYLTPIYEPSWNYTRLAMAWAEVVWLLVLAAVTVWKLGKTPLEPTRKRLTRFVVLWAVWLALKLTARLGLVSKVLLTILTWDTAYRITNCVLEDLRLGLFTAILVLALGFARYYAAERKAVRKAGQP